MSLKDKSNAEISHLLTDYGIKHGPVVRSTRSLYERKLEEAMANDQTFYREEEEEIMYITYHHPIRRKTSANSRATGALPPLACFISPAERVNQRSTADQDKDQPPDQVEEIPKSRLNQRSSTDPLNDQQPDKVTEVPSSRIGLGNRAETQEQKQQDQVNFAFVKVSHRTANHSVESRRPVRGRSEGKAWMIPAVLLLIALTAGCYYSLSTGM